MNSSWRRILSLLLTLALVLGLTTPVFAASSSNSSKLKAAWEKVENAASMKQQLLSKNKVEELKSEPLYKDSDRVRVSIILSRKATLDMGYEASSIAKNANAKSYREGLKTDQKTIAQRISSQALGGKSLDVVWNLTLAANIISANVLYGQIEAIKGVDGVRDVVVENRYEPALASREELDPDMSVASGMTGGNQAWLSGYTGAGTAVAIVDTGLDLEHKSFDPKAFDYSISTIDKDVDLITKDEIAAVLDQLNASEMYEGLTADDVYRSTKVPFAFNYVDGGLDVLHSNDRQGEHGSHVAGIAAGNRFVSDGKGGFTEALSEVRTNGEAPDAQLMVMKVFGKGGGAYDSDYMAAIEDAIVLGAASTNLSLGSGNPGLANAGQYEEILNKVAQSDMILAMSAGNSYHWANSTTLGYLYAEDKSFATNGSPGSYTNTLASASVENDGFTGAYIEFNGTNIYYTETSDYGNKPLVTVGGTYDYVYIDSYGADVDENDNFTVNMFEGIDLTGKVGITNRGTSSFYVKANAIAGAGAVAAIIANNQPGTINMNLTGYMYTAPAVSITQADAQLLKKGATSKDTVKYTENGTEKTADVYYGTIKVGSDVGTVVYGEDRYTMSDFSSWGVPGNLSLKPEITAPGGNIYSVNGYHLDESGKPAGGHTAYENMSGTSMASPQTAGLAAVLRQYIEENGLEEKTGLTARQLATSLLMSTAKPLISKDTETYYSLLNQGAGLAKVDQAINSRTYIVMDESATASAKDGKVKAELGEVGDKFEVGFTIYNMSGEDIDMTLRSDMFTQDMFLYYAVDPDGKPVGRTAYAEYLDTATIDVDHGIDWLLDDTPYEPESYDINGDGKYDEKDAQDLLSYIVGKATPTDAWNLDIADVDGNKKTDTYDAYLLLSKLGAASVAVPANGKVHVTAKFEVKDAAFDIENSYGMDFSFEDIANYFGGDYIEAFIFAEESASEDGAMGVEHSIPVLGFYGDWSESPMFDKGSYLDYTYGEEYRYPYMAAAFGENSKSIQTFVASIDGQSVYFGGNPFITDTDADGNPVYLPERNAVSKDNPITALRYTLIRNAAASRLMIKDQTGKALLDNIGGTTYSAFYYVNGAEWRNTNYTMDIANKVAEASEGDVLTYSLTFAPEYFVKADGSVDWDALSENATMAISATVDNTAPEILDVTSEVTEAAEPAEGEEAAADTYTVNVKVKDNQYIAAILMMDEAGYKASVAGQQASPLGVFGSDISAKAGDQTEYTFEFGADETQTPGQLMVEVYDYAGNSSVYKINLEKEDQYADPDAYSLEFVPDEITIIGKNTAKLQWLAGPWGIEQEEGFSISFESSDETVATVDENGIVSVVTDKDGSCVITGTIQYKEFTAEAECTVNVKFINKVLRGVVWDEEGQRYISEFNLNSLPEYKKLSEHLKTAEIASIADDIYAEVMYGASLDTENFTSVLYTLDPAKGYEPTEIGASSIGYTDLAIAPGLSVDTGKDILVGTYGNYAVFIDAATGEYIGAYQFSGDLVGIAYEGTGQYEPGLYTDYYFFIDTDGNVHETGFIYMQGTYYWYSDKVDGNLGYSTGTDYFNSAHISFEEDGTENLYWSRFDMNENKVDILVTEIIYDEKGNVSLGPTLKAGSFADSVWPVGGLYDPPVEEDPESGESLVTVEKVKAVKPEAAAVSEIEKIDRTVNISKGSTNAVKGAEVVVRPQGMGKPEITPTIMANFDITADQNTHNGLVVLTYDKVAMSAQLVSVNADMYDYKEDLAAGTITFAFANKDVIAQGKALAQIKAVLYGDECVGAVTIDNKEMNNGVGSVLETEISNHEWIGEPEWTWDDLNRSASAAFECEKCGEFETVEAEVVLDGDKYIATVTGPDGAVYTDEAPVYKFMAQVSSKAADGGIGYVAGAVFGDYSADLVINGDSVNTGNVAVDLWMRNVASLGVEDERSYSASIKTGADARDIPMSTVTDLFKAIDASGKTKIKGVIGEDEVTYTVKRTDEEGRRFNASPDSADSAAAVWHAIVNSDNVITGTKDEDSYIILANGSCIQLGKQLLSFESEEDLRLDNFSDLKALNEAVRKALKLDAAEDSKVQIFLAKGTELAVGSSYAKLNRGVTITADIPAADAEALGTILTELRDAAGIEELMKAAVKGIGAVVDAIGGKTTTVEVEFEPAETIDIKASISVRGEVKLALADVTVTDLDFDGTITVGEALVAVHDTYYEGGAEAGYATATSQWGESITKLWGDENASIMYWKNNESCYSLSDALEAGDVLYAYTFKDEETYSDAYAWFDKSEYTSEDGTLAVKISKSIFDENWTPSVVPEIGAAITVYDADLKEVDPALYNVKDNDDGSYRLVFLEKGEYIIVATNEKTNIVPAIAAVSVTAAAELKTATVTGISLNLEDKISVQFKIQPDENMAYALLELQKPDDSFEDPVKVVLDKSDATVYKEAEDRFVVKYSEITSKMISQGVKLTIFDKDDVPMDIYRTTNKVTYTQAEPLIYSAATWSNDAIAALGTDTSNKVVFLAMAVLNFGGEAQKALGDYNPDHPANPKGYLADEMAALKKDPAFDLVISDANAKQKGYSGMTLDLAEQTKLRIKFNSNVAVKLGGKPATLKQEGSKYVLDITGLKCYDLEDPYEIEFTGIDGSTITLKACALSWSNLVFDANSAEFLPLAKAVYLYSQASVNYFR